MILLYKNKEGIQTNKHNNIFSISSIEGNDYKKGGRRENERKKKITQRNDMKIFPLKFFFLVKNEERDGNTER